MYAKTLLILIFAAANPMLAMKRPAESSDPDHGKLAPKLQSEAPAAKYSRFPLQIQQELIELDKEQEKEQAELANHPDYDPEWDSKEKLRTTREKLSRLLFVPILRGDCEKMQVLLSCGANPNVRASSGYLLLMSAALMSRRRPVSPVLQVLLNHGADIRLRHGTREKHKSWERKQPLEACVTRFSGRLHHQPLIIYSKFTPYFTERGLKQAQQRTRTRLCCLARACPQLPRDIKGLILLAYDKRIRRDAYGTPLKIHTKQYDRVPQMPLPVIRALIKHDALELEKTKNTLVAHKYNQLRPLMARAFKIIQKKDNPNPTEQTELNPDLLEQNFGKQIEEVIIADCFDKQGDENV